jgi:hypothetical protein
MRIMIFKYILFLSIIFSFNYKCTQQGNKNNTVKIVNELTDKLTHKFHLQKDTISNVEIKNSYLFAYEQYCGLPLHLSDRIVNVTSGGVNGKLDSIPAQFLNIECYKIHSNDAANEISKLVSQKIGELEDSRKQTYYCIEDKSMRVNKIFIKSDILVTISYEGFNDEISKKLIDNLEQDFYNVVY